MPQIVIGLGNPGGQYARTRHNAGWMVLDQLAKMGHFTRERKSGHSTLQTGDVQGFDLELVRPQTLMNDSGKAAAEIVRRTGIDPRHFIVVHDDIDMPLGQIRVRARGSAGGQRGVQSLIALLGTPNFTRVKVGVGRPNTVDAIDYVLAPFKPDERELLPDVLKRAAEAVVSLVRNGLEPTMTEFNSRQL